MSDCYACVCYIWCNEREARRKEGKKREEYRVGTSVLDFVCVVSSQPAAKEGPRVREQSGSLAVCSLDLVRV